MASAVPGLGLEGPALLVDDPRSDVAAALQAAGIPCVRWFRADGPLGEGASWPSGGPYGAALIRLPRSREALEFALHGACAVLRSGGRVVVYGAGDEGIGSTPARMTPLLEDVAVRANARRCRVLEGVFRPGAGEAVRGTLEAWRRAEPVDLGWGPLPWVSYPGTFAAGGLDAGTALLLEHLPAVTAGDRVVDFGAGTGVLARALCHAVPGVRVLMVEPDAPSRTAAGENVPDASFLPVAGWESAGPFRAVVSNPPYHVGKAESLEVVEILSRESARGLAPDGELLLVVQRRMAVEPILTRDFRQVQVLADRGPHRVWRAAAPVVRP